MPDPFSAIPAACVIDSCTMNCKRETFLLFCCIAEFSFAFVIILPCMLSMFIA